MLKRAAEARWPLSEQPAAIDCSVGDGTRTAKDHVHNRAAPTSKKWWRFSMKTVAHHGDKAEILRRLRDVGPDRRARWGRMSAHQMICHLSDSLRMATGEKSVSNASGLLHRTILKWIVLYAPLRWPAGVPTRPEIDQEIGGTSPFDFAADVAELEALLDCITTQSGSIDRRAHPVFGRMSKAAWLRWAYLHMDHHLRQFGV
jgi:hypothetical protein